MHTDLLDDAWGWDRLVPFVGGVDWSTYINYLNQYYDRNQSQLYLGGQIPSGSGGNVNGLAAAAEFCLKMEEQLMSELKKQEEQCPGVPSLLICNSGLIHKLAGPKINAAEFSAPAAAFLCIATEADVIMELLKDCTEDTLHLITFSCNIRLSLMDCKGGESIAVAAAMVGISKEAKLVCKYLRDPEWPFFLCIDGETELGGIRGKMLGVLMRMMEGSSASVHNPAKIEPSDEAVHSGNGNGIADAAAAEESAGNNT